jgi:glycosyltransferase involved in cell wall biosynthesis
MDILVVADGHYYKTPDGTVYCDSIYDYNFYKRYLLGFDHVYAAIRTENIQEVPRGKKVSSGDNVTFLPLPAYRGPIEYLKKYFEIKKYIKKYCMQYDRAVFRIPAASSNVFCRQFAKTGKPFAVEVVIDPWENFGPGTAGNPVINWIVRRDWTSVVKTMCHKATGASYVTEQYLQKRYPPRAYTDKSGKFFTANYSSVELPDDSFANPREWNKEQTSFVISHVSNLFTGYGKGHLELMQAVKRVREDGYDVSIRFVGDGPKKEEFKEYARSLGIEDHVDFVGKLPSGQEVRRAIHDSDIFILPTRAEGLPRALLEAMSEGIPCLSSPVCGIPEVLSEEYMFDYNDINGYVRGIERFICNPDLMTAESKKNIEIAKKYASSILNERRKEFYIRLSNSI